MVVSLLNLIDDSYEDDDDYGQYGGYASEHSLDFPCANAMQKVI